MDNYFINLQTADFEYITKVLLEKEPAKDALIWEFYNEIKPADLYCYLYAKYGMPNGIQNILRSDDSDNLIHWEWSLKSKDGLMLIQGHNFRTEVQLIGTFKSKGLTPQMFLDNVKSDIGNYGKQISELRKNLEKWTQFVNPFYRIESAVNQHLKKLDELNLDLKADKVPHPKSSDDFKSYGDRLSSVSEKYSFAIGIIFGLQAMLPVLAESFVNLLLFILCKPEIKRNERLLQNTVRQPIDIRVQSLHLNCIGFKAPVDYTAEECKMFQTLMNERNNLLHGNVEVSKLSIGDVYFNGKVPIFLQYEDFWDKSIGVSLRSVKFESIKEDHASVIYFINYILEQLEPRVKEEFKLIMKKGQLGFNNKNGRIGILFPEHMVDFRAVMK